MITGFALVCLNVLDLDEAKRFYVDVLGFEVGIDRELEGFRWLTVLVVPEPPAVEEPIAGQLRSLVARGYLGLGALRTDDCRATCEELKARGVEFIEEPEERFYGIDAAFRDPFGNHWRLTQPRTLGEIREIAT
jgi:catechol 2,3-dioxygenase-like lactoylglutathione lyase family enzyme